MPNISDYRSILINGIKLEEAREIDNAKKLYVMAIQSAGKAECGMDALELFYGDKLFSDNNAMNYSQAIDRITVALCAADLCDLIFQKLPANQPGGWAVVGVDVAPNGQTTDMAEFFRFLYTNDGMSTEDINIFNKVKVALKKGPVPFKMRTKYNGESLISIIKGLVSKDIEIRDRENELV